MLDWVSDTVVAPASDVLVTLVRPAVQFAAAQTTALTESLTQTLFRRLYALLDTAEHTLAPAAADLIQTSFEELRGRMRFTLPPALLNGLLTTVQTTVSNTLTTAQADVDALVGAAVAALPSGFLTSTELAQVESWTQTEIASSITGVTGNVVTIVSNAGDAVQACLADFMFSPAIPALLVNMTNAVLSELPAALRQVLGGRSGPVGSFCFSITNGEFQPPSVTPQPPSVTSNRHRLLSKRRRLPCNHRRGLSKLPLVASAVHFCDEIMSQPLNGASLRFDFGNYKIR